MGFLSLYASRAWPARANTYHFDFLEEGFLSLYAPRAWPARANTYHFDFSEVGFLSLYASRAWPVSRCGAILQEGEFSSDDETTSNVPVAGL